jgi:aryl-alcohol dehydrogenase-like predicted oxidoreductase
MERTAPTKLKLADVEVARIGLGTNRLTKTPDHVAFVQEAVAAGVNLIDTAHTYAGGQSEDTIGTALSSMPGGCLVETKGGWDGARPEVLRAEIEESLRRLRSDGVGLYYLHRPDPRTAIEESLSAISEYRDGGKIQDVGVSNVGVEEIERAREVVPIVAVQNPYSLAERRYEDVVDYCAAEGLVFVAYFPLRRVGGGAVTDVAAQLGATEAQVALAWILKRSPTLLPIPGTLSLEHLKENLAALEIELGDSEFEALSR